MKTITTFCTICLLWISMTGWAQEYEIYVCDAGGFNNPPWKIMRFDENGDNPETLDDTNVSWPQDILILEDDDIFLTSSLNTGLITRHEIGTGNFINNFATVAGGPTRMKIGPDGFIYVLQWQGNGTVLRYQTDGTFEDEFTTVGVSNSIGIDWDASGNLYVSSFNGATVRMYDTNGNDMGLFIDTNLTGPTDLRFRDNGDLLVLDWSAGDVKLFDSAGVFQGIFIDNLSQPEGIDVFPNGDILIGDGGNAQVLRYDSDGNFIEIFIDPGSGGLIQPNCVTIRDTNLSVEDNALSNVFVTPTVGQSFSIGAHINSEFEQLSVYSISGKLIETLHLNEQSSWEASGYADGVYFIVANKNGQRLTQKVIVRKR